MCSLAVYSKSFPTMPLLIAANRDEFYDRASAPPTLLCPSPPVFGGRDEVHGGTWLAVNAYGVAAALLNRRTNEPLQPLRRSRGLLCLDALMHPSTRLAMEALSATDPDAYNPFNLLVADAEEAWVMTNWGGVVRQVQLRPGLHLLTNLDIDDMECPRIAKSTKRFAKLERSAPAEPLTGEFQEHLRGILSDHGTPLDPRGVGPGSGLCVHLDRYGTRSSTLLGLSHSGRWTFLHSTDAPCMGVYREFDLGVGF